jgi:hypothetical protein
MTKNQKARLLEEISWLYELLEYGQVDTATLGEEGLDAAWCYQMIAQRELLLLVNTIPNKVLIPTSATGCIP